MKKIAIRTTVLFKAIGVARNLSRVSSPGWPKFEAESQERGRSCYNRVNVVVYVIILLLAIRNDKNICEI